MTNNKPNDVRVSRELRSVLAMVLNALDRDAEEGKAVRGEMAAELRAILAQPADPLIVKLTGPQEWLDELANAAQPADQQGDPPRATEKDIERWHALIAESPEGPWVMGNGGSFDRQGVKPISDELMSELGQWLRMGYTPWNGRSVSPSDRQFMYLLYYSVQGLVSRVRRAERDLHHAQPATAKVVLPERRELSQSTPYLSDLDHEWNACLDEVAKLNTPQ